MQARVAEIRAVANLGPGPVTSTTVGGLPAQQLDLVPLAGGPEETVVPGMSERYFLSPGDHERLWIVSVHGATVTISAGTTAGRDFSAFIPAAERVIGTVRWPK